MPAEHLIPRAGTHLIPESEQLDGRLRLGAVPSVGNTGDTFDNALAQWIKPGYERVAHPRTRSDTRKGVDDVALATLSWIYGYNSQRLHEGTSTTSPTAELEDL